MTSLKDKIAQTVVKVHSTFSELITIGSNNYPCVLVSNNSYKEITDSGVRQVLACTVEISKTLLNKPPVVGSVALVIGNTYKVAGYSESVLVYQIYLKTGL